jgi:hypothetical protein
MTMEEPKVFDMHNSERDMAWVRQTYGSDFARATPEMLTGATQVYRLIEFREREGPSNIDTFVMGEDDQLLANITVAFYWPDAPTPSRPEEWKPKKYYQRTDTTGKVGFALGPGAYIRDPALGSPHAIWVSEPTTPSDVADKLGMLAGTNHRHLEPVFQLQPVEMVSLTIDYPSDGAVLTVNEMTVTGKTQPGFTVILTVNATQMPSVVADSDGVYRFTEVQLEGGTNVLSAKAISASGEVESEPVTMRVQVSLEGDEWEQKYWGLHAEFEQFKADVRRLSGECGDRIERAQTELTQARAKTDEIKRLLQ